MSYQMALCSRIVKSGDITSVLNYGITEDDFTEPKAKSLWNLIAAYYMQPETRGAVITPTMMQMWFPTLITQDDMPGMPVQALCFEVRRSRVITSANDAFMKCTEELSVPTSAPLEPLQLLHKRLGELISLGTSASTDVSFATGYANIIKKMQLAASGVDLSIAPWPWQPLQDATFGLQPDDYIILYGRPKSMKTWVLAFALAQFFLRGKKLLVYTKEMTPDNIYLRTLACICKIVYSSLREATFTTKALSRIDALALQEVGDAIMTDPEWANKITVLSGRDCPANGDTVSWLNSKLDEYKPDIMCVDGMYLLSDEKKATVDHTRVMNISRGLRQMNLNTGVPLICTMQANRKAAGHSEANLDEIAYSDGVAQDATIAARVINDKASPTISLVIGGSREFALHGIRIHAKPATDFSTHSVLTEKDIQKAKETDVGEAEKKEKREKGKKVTRAPQTEEKNVEDQIDKAVDVAQAHLQGKTN